MKALFSIFFALFTLSVQAVELELSIGQAKRDMPTKGIWWQPGPASEGFSTNFDMKSTAYAIGVTDYWKPAIRWRAGYANLGGSESIAYATSADPDYDYENERCLPGCVMALYHGHAHVHGIYATLAPEYKRGDWRVYVEGGVWLYRHKFQMGDDVQTPNMNRQIAPGLVLGIGIGHKNTDISYRAYQVDIRWGNLPSIDQGFTHVLAVQQRF